MKRFSKNVVSFILIFLISFVVVSPQAKADIGPKPGVHINVKGMEGQRYYVTLLSKTDIYGPWSDNQPYEEHNNATGDKAIFDKVEDEKVHNIFKKFKDTDGYYYLSFRGVYEGDDTFSWTYYAPENFKILIYLLNNQGGKFFVSEPLEEYAFDSYYDVNINGEMLEASENIVNISADSINKPSYFTTNSINFFALIARIVITIAIEIAFARLLKISSFTAIKAILQANIVTQIILNVILLIGNYRFGYLAYLFLLIALELFIAIGEALYYKKKFTRNDKLMLGPFAYGILANVLSFLIGFYILEKILPIVIL